MCIHQIFGNTFVYRDGQIHLVVVLQLSTNSQGQGHLRTLCLFLDLFYFPFSWCSSISFLFLKMMPSFRTTTGPDYFTAFCCFFNGIPSMPKNYISFLFFPNIAYATILSFSVSLMQQSPISSNFGELFNQKSFETNLKFLFYSSIPCFCLYCFFKTSLSFGNDVKQQLIRAISAGRSTKQACCSHPMFGAYNPLPNSQSYFAVSIRNKLRGFIFDISCATDNCTETTRSLSSLFTTHAVTHSTHCLT